MTPSEEFTERYKTIKSKADEFGRVIGVRRLKPSQQVKISEMTPALEGDTEMTGQDGRTIRIPRRSLPMVAAAVCQIDGAMIPFPKTRGELDAILDRLDAEGLLAAVQAYGELVPSVKTDDGEGAKDVIDDAKK